MPFYGVGIITLLAQFACAAHVMRSGRPWLWIPAIVFLPWIGAVFLPWIGAVFLPWIGVAAYVVFAVLPDAVRNSRPARRVADELGSITDPGTSYSRKKRDVEMVGSAQSKRLFAEECIKRGRFQEAVDLYESAMEGAHAEDPALLHGLARARLGAGDGAGAQAAFELLRTASLSDFTADARLDYARALVAQGKNKEAKAEYESLLPVYAGQEARCRFAQLLVEMGERERAQRLFREIVDSVRGAPGYSRRREREWVNIAKKELARLS